MPDILLVKPLSQFSLQSVPPLGLGFIANYIREKGRTVDILDCNLDRIDPEQLAARISKDQYRIIGFHCFDMDVPITRDYIDRIKAIIPDQKVIVGGPAPSSAPQRVLKVMSNIDYLCFGEGEETVNLLIDAFEKGIDDLSHIPNLMWKNNGEMVRNEHCYMADLDEVGAPSWDILTPQKYGNAVHGFFYRKLPVYPVMVTRGCPYNCQFCGSRLVTGFKVRRRSPVEVFNELKQLRDQYGMGEFQIVDDNFTASRQAALELCNLLVKNDLILPWTCPNGLRLDTLDEELLLAMKAAGCYEVSVGIESGDQRILDAMQKKLTLDVVEEKIKLINKCGINMNGFVIIGYPGETEETLTNSMNFMLKQPLNRISLSHFVPLPGTPIFKELVEAGKLKDEPESTGVAEYKDIHYVPDDMSREQLEKLYKRFFWSFYLRPKVILYNLSCIRSFSHLYNIAKRAFSYLY